MPDKNQHHPGEALEAPPKLVSALGRLPQEPVFIPPTVDDAVLRAARRQLEGPQQARLGWMRFMPWVAAAAALVLLAVLPRFLRQPAPGPARDLAFAQWDLNHDGRTDILDAFAVARALKQAGSKNLQLDVNDDGAVDERDVTALAAHAVKLEQGGRS